MILIQTQAILKVVQIKAMKLHSFGADVTANSTI